MITNAYIDASNLFYGGKKSLGWSIDFQKLITYLQRRFEVSNIYYFGGIETHNYPYDYMTDDSVVLKDLEDYLVNYIDEHNNILKGTKLMQIDQNLKQVRFYKKLEEFGFIMILKPVKIHIDDKGQLKRKANCDVEMTFYMMRDKDDFERILVLSGDGDFLPVLKYLRNVIKKEVLILSRGPRTAKEIKKFAGDKFIDLTDRNMRSKLEKIEF